MLKNTFKNVSIFYCNMLSHMLVYICKEDKEPKELKEGEVQNEKENYYGRGT